MTEFLRPFSPQETERLTPKQWIAYHSFMGWINCGLREGITDFDMGNPSFLGDTMPRFLLGLKEKEAGKVVNKVLDDFKGKGWEVENLDPGAPSLLSFRITRRS